ncbi:MAG: NAD-glutamate dehydrogenase [Magnetococcales bacterium]|nr:NAD-glutamate dehydrogenase [Magnetococcales bacterium]
MPKQTPKKSPAPAFSLDNLLKEITPLLPDTSRKLADLFIKKVIEGMRVSQTIPHGMWCNPQGLISLFQFFKNPIDNTGKQHLKVRVDRQEVPTTDTQTSLSSPQEGVRIMIHLQDTPFILETLRNYLKQSRLTIFAQAHTTFITNRNEHGKLLAFDTVEDTSENREMVLLILTEPVNDDQQLIQLESDLHAVLSSVKNSVDDFPAMTKRLKREADQLKKERYLTQSKFLNWIISDNFVFMGLRSLIVSDGKLHHKSGDRPLGVYRGRKSDSVLDHIMPGMRKEIEGILIRLIPEHLKSEQNSSKNLIPLLSVEYCQHGESIIYASEGVDFFTIRRPYKDHGGSGAGASSQAWEFLLILGRFSRAAMANRASLVPILDERLKQTLELSNHPPGSYLYHEFSSLYDRMPIRELLYSQPDVITRQIQRILTIQGDIDVRMDARLGQHGNYVSILTVLSRNRYHGRLSNSLSKLLSSYLDYPISSTTVSETGTLFFIVCYANHDPDKPFEFHHQKVEKAVRDLVLNWEDKLRESLLGSLSQRKALRRFVQYADRFDAIFKEATPPAQAAQDIDSIELMISKDLRFSSRVIHQPGKATYIKLYSRELISLTRIVQTFDHFGIICLHEFSTNLVLADNTTIRIQRFEVGGTLKERKRISTRSDLFCAALEHIQSGVLHDDRLNRLVVQEGFSPKEVFLLRCLRQYLLQITPELARSTINRVANTHHGLIRLILDAFRIRFQPELSNRNAQFNSIAKAFEDGLQAVGMLQEDQILRNLFNIVEATLRTNYFQKDWPEAICLKIRSATINKMPSPRPWREIFVLGSHMEGVHLRGGRVARGGLRFSDRLEDYRTEVLGLMKTQMVKNAIIVPMGAKGGFVIPVFAHLSIQERKTYASNQYKVFIRALLDITDNLIDGNVVHPDQVTIHDGEDPYLVVAADKGTATFSDLANHVAQKTYNFWLGDAFASGGSNGYDHKKVGITARGAWECIRLHFEEMNRNIHTDAFSVVAIGDMSGDVFGNGLLASDKIQLIGAFNHLHIFVDPEPNPEISFKERQRLFKLPRSSWTDYNTDLISEGGGVFDRTAKTIPIHPAMQHQLGIEENQLSGESLIQALLTAPVDLLFNGGIGTYIKSSQETHLDVSDKTNDAVRVDAKMVCAAIIGEGGNLGITQKGRLEFANAGGRINTDALDNSGGVDLSDHEVNLKILLDFLVSLGEIHSIDERNRILSNLTDEIAQQVLADNRFQHQTISRDSIYCLERPEMFLDALRFLHERAGLDFDDEDIPDIKTLQKQLQTKPIPRPLLAIILGYLKLYTFQQLLASDVVDMFFFEQYLTDYFPVPITRSFPAHLTDHFLKREIIATTLTNRVVNQTGIGLLFYTLKKVLNQRVLTNPLPLLIKSYLIVENLLDASGYRRQVHELGPEVDIIVKYEALFSLEKVLLHLAGWMINNMEGDRINIDLINLYGKVILSFRDGLWQSLPELLSETCYADLKQKRHALMKTGLPRSLATQIVVLPFLRDTMNILHIKERLHTRFQEVGHLYIQVDDYFGLSWIEKQLTTFRHRDMWGQLNLENIRRELWEVRTRMVIEIINFKRHNESVKEAFSNYLNEVMDVNEEYQALLEQLKPTKGSVDLLPLSVLVHKLNDLLLNNRTEWTGHL